MRQEVNELNQHILKKKDEYSEFLRLIKEVVKLANFEDQPPKIPLIHEDLEEIEKLKTEFDEAFAKAER